jgi:branched-chain amino acid transport system permease protein
VAISTESADSEAAVDSEDWVRQYARDHVAHLLVVVAFGVYPLLYSVLIAVGGSVSEAFLPRPETMTAVFYFGLFAMSFDFISGYTGYLSFGHAAFYGAGGYFVVLVANGKIPLLPADTPFMVSMLLAGVLAAVLAVIIGSVSFRLSGVYFAMVTLGFAQVIYVFMRDWEYVSSNPRDGVAVSNDLHPAGFEIGIPGIDALNFAVGPLRGDTVDWLFLQLGATEVSYYMVGAVVLVCYLAMQRMVHSPFGRVLIAIRENEERARAVGYNTFRYKLGAFAASAFFAGIAGALFAGVRRSVSPDNSLYFLVSGDALLASIIGGFGTLAGPLYGWLFDQSVVEFLSKTGGGGGLLPLLREYLPASVVDTPLVGGMTFGEGIEVFLNGHAPLYLGVVFVVFVLYVPGGLLGALRNRMGGTVAKQLPDYLAKFRR